MVVVANCGVASKTEQQLDISEIDSELVIGEKEDISILVLDVELEESFSSGEDCISLSTCTIPSGSSLMS